MMGINSSALFNKTYFCLIISEINLITNGWTKFLYGKRLILWDQSRITTHLRRYSLSMSQDNWLGLVQCIGFEASLCAVLHNAYASGNAEHPTKWSKCICVCLVSIMGSYNQIINTPAFIKPKTLQNNQIPIDNWCMKLSHATEYNLLSITFEVKHDFF